MRKAISALSVVTLALTLFFSVQLTKNSTGEILEISSSEASADWISENCQGGPRYCSTTYYDQNGYPISWGNSFYHMGGGAQ